MHRGCFAGTFRDARRPVAGKAVASNTGRVHRTTCSASLIVLTLALLPDGVSAASPWTAPTTLSDPAHNATAPDLAVDGRGGLHAVWIATADNGNGVVEYAERPVGAGWTAPVALSSDATDAIEPDVDSNAQGGLVVAWSASSDASTGLALFIRRRFVGGTWTPRTRLSTTDDDTWGAQPLLNDDGDLAVAWRSLDPVTHRYQGRVRIRQRGGDWSPVHALAPSVTTTDVGIVLDAAGVVTAAWREISGPPRSETWRVFVSTKPVAAGWLAPTKVSGSSTNDSGPVLALRGGTVPWLAWEHTADQVSGVWVRHRTPTGWSKATRVNAAGTHASFPTIAANARGGLIVAWSSASRWLRSRVLTPRGSWRPIARIANPGGSWVSAPQVQITRDLTAYAFWLAGPGRVLVARCAPSVNDWRELTAVPGESISDPQLAVSPQGLAALAWRLRTDPAQVQVMLHR